MVRLGPEEEFSTVRYPANGEPEEVSLEGANPYAEACAYFVQCVRGEMWQTARPERTRSLPNGDVELCDVDIAMEALGEFVRTCALEKQAESFLQVGARLFDGISLTRDV